VLVFHEVKLICWLIAVMCADVCMCFRANLLLEILRKRAAPAVQPVIIVSILHNRPEKNPKAAEANSSSM